MAATSNALDAANGQKLWGQELGGAIGGGVNTYTANGAQKVAVAAGFTHIQAHRDFQGVERFVSGVAAASEPQP